MEINCVILSSSLRMLMYVKTADRMNINDLTYPKRTYRLMISNEKKDLSCWQYKLVQLLTFALRFLPIV